MIKIIRKEISQVRKYSYVQQLALDHRVLYFMKPHVCGRGYDAEDK